MSVDPSVIAAIEAAVARDPDNPALRGHLAALRLRAGDHRAALSEARTALMRAPRDRGALAVARDAARLLGDDAQAEGFGRVLADLQGHAPVELPSVGPPSPALAPLAPPRPRDEAGHEQLERSLGIAPARDRVTLADVAGPAGVRDRLERAFVGPLRRPSARGAAAATARGGLLLYGPPGCGKTFLARAIAGELGAELLAVGCDELPATWAGRGDHWLEAVFGAARRRVPGVVFLDELDALGARRRRRRSGGRRAVDQLLSELDAAHADGVAVVAATSRPWDVDPALRRAGRLDRAMLVLPPDAAARAGILSRALLGPSTARIDAEKLAARTDGFTAAELVRLVDAALDHARAESVHANVPRPITQKDLERARREISPSTLAWFATAHSYALYDGEDGTYGELLAHMREQRLL